MRSLRSVLVLGAIMLGALLGLAFAATYTASADHEGERHITRGPINEQLKHNLGGSSCPWVSFFDGTFAHVDGKPLKHCNWNAKAADIAEARTYEALGLISVIYGGRSFFALPEDLILTPGGWAALPGIPESVDTLSELHIHRIAECLRGPEFSFTGPLWLNGSIWCQHLAGVTPTASFSTE